MANTLTAIMPKILARALMVMRERAIMPRLVNGDYSSEAAQKGSTIDVPIPTAKAASDVTPAAAQPTPSDTVMSTVQITLENWKKVNFFLTDKDIQYIDRDAAYLPMELGESARSLANAINTTIFSEYGGVYGQFGSAGTAPFGSDVSAITGIRKILNKQLCPLDSRRLVVDFGAEANMLALAAFANAEQTLSAQVKIEGEIGRKYGFDCVADDAVPTHSQNALGTGALTVNGTHVVGATTLSVAKAAGENWIYKVGDLITIAGETAGLNSYTLGTGVAGAIGGTIVQNTNTSVIVSPALRSAKSGSEGISLPAGTTAVTYYNNLAFHRDAFAFAMRPLVQTTTDLQLGNKIVSLTDPVTGLTLRLEITRQYKQTMWELDCLWGTKLVRPELAARLLG